jgi:hypothetical protein
MYAIYLPAKPNGLGGIPLMTIENLHLLLGIVQSGTSLKTPLSVRLNLLGSSEIPKL